MSSNRNTILATVIPVKGLTTFLTGIKNTVAVKISLPKKIKVRSLEEVPRLGRSYL